MYLNPNKIILDFEIAVINAIGAVLGNGITKVLFLSCHSTFRKLQELGLKNLYENDEEFKLFVGTLDQIVQGMEHLRHVQSPKLND